MSDQTYYFSYAEGIRKRNKCKQREMLKEPKRISNSVMGFDINVD